MNRRELLTGGICFAAIPVELPKPQKRRKRSSTVGECCVDGKPFKTRSQLTNPVTNSSLSHSCQTMLRPGQDHK